MANDFLGDHPELRPYVLSDVQLTGTTIGHGAYGSVEEVAVPVCGAAKKVHDLLLGSPKITSQFAEELQLMSTLRHPNIVQFLGLCFFPGSRLPVLVMERLLTSLHDLLDPETDDAQPPPSDAPRPLSFFTMALKCRVLHNVASGLAYFHERSPPIIHRDLSAKNVLLTSELVGKIADLGVARIVPRMRAAATMTKAPGASVYMPPEAIAPAKSNEQKSKYDASIDMFSFGVVTIFTIGEVFPCDPLAHNYTNEETGLLVAHTELQRRSQYMRSVNTQLRACGQLRGDHPLIQLIQQCLQNVPAKRPSIREVLGLIELARAGIRDEESERNKEELVRAFHNQPRNQNMEKVHEDLMRDVTELQQQLQSSSQQLRRKEAELTRAEETIRREQQQIQEMRVSIRREQQLVQAKDRELAQAQDLVTETMKREQAKDRELAQAQQQLRQQVTEKDELVQAKDRELAQAQQQLRQQVTEKDELVQAKDRELAQAQQQLRQQEQSSRREIGDLERQLRSSEALVADFQKTHQQRDSELETLRSKTQRLEPPPPQTRTLSSSSASQAQQQSSRPGPSVTAGPHSIPHYKQGKLTVQCHDKKTAPRGISRGSATSDLQYAYFMPWDSHSAHRYRYEWSTEKWDKLPLCPYSYSALVIIDGALTAVGGYNGSHFTNKLFTLRQRQWVEELSPMKTARSKTAVVSTSDGEYVLVIGGSGGGGWTATVELFQVRSRRWSDLTHLPRPLTLPSATICGNHIHVIGGDDNGFSCSLQDLPSSDQPTMSQSRSRTISWSPLPPLPVTASTAATLCGQLVIIGGRGGRSSVKSIHQLVDGQWVEIGYMSSGRRMCLVVSSSPDKMMIVGGWGRMFSVATDLDSVEECVVVLAYI